MVKDSLGSPLQVGDQIAYAVREGNSAAMKHYIVQGFDDAGWVIAYNMDIYVLSIESQQHRRKSFLRDPSARAVLVK